MNQEFQSPPTAILSCKNNQHMQQKHFLPLVPSDRQRPDFAFSASLHFLLHSEWSLQGPGNNLLACLHPLPPFASTTGTAINTTNKLSVFLQCFFLFFLYINITTHIYKTKFVSHFQKRIQNKNKNSVEDYLLISTVLKFW